MPQQEGDQDGEFPFFPPPSKGSGRPGGPPGGGPGGQVGGGFLSFAGVRPQVMRGITGFGQQGLPITMRKRGFQPGVTPGPPGRGDTVPAMLSPGEAVASNGAQAMNPGLTEEILQSNQQAMGYEDGGMVPEMGGARPSRALRLLQLLLDLDEADSVGGAQPQGFAFGGMAQDPRLSNQPTGGNGAGGTQMGGGFVPRNFGSGGGAISGGGSGAFGGAVGRMFGPGGMRPGAQPGGSVQPPAPQGGFQYTRDSAGNQTNFNPASPWTGYQQNTGATGLGAGNRMFGQAGEMGAFDPRGNQQLLRSQLEGAQGDADALVRRQMSAVDLSGMDPAQAATAKLQALRETGRGVQDIGAKVRAGGADRAQSFNEELMRELMGADLGYIRGEQGARNDRIAQQNAGRIANQAGGGYWGQLAGNVIGSAAGSFNPFGGGGGVPRTAIAANPDPGLYNLPRPN